MADGEAAVSERSGVLPDRSNLTAGQLLEETDREILAAHEALHTLDVLLAAGAIDPVTSAEKRKRLVRKLDGLTGRRSMITDRRRMFRG